MYVWEVVAEIPWSCRRISTFVVVEFYINIKHPFKYSPQRFDMQIWNLKKSTGL